MSQWIFGQVQAGETFQVRLEEKSTFVTEGRSLSGGFGHIPLGLPAKWRASLTELLRKLFLPVFHKDAFDFDRSLSTQGCSGNLVGIHFRRDLMMLC